MKEYYIVILKYVHRHLPIILICSIAFFEYVFEIYLLLNLPVFIRFQNFL